MQYVYETVIIFNPDEKIAKKEIRNIKTILSVSSTGLISLDNLGVKKLAYPLREEKFTEGYYAVFTWIGTPDSVSYLEAQMRINDNILKFMTVKSERDPDEEEVIQQEEESEQQQDTPDALDVLLGLAKYEDRKEKK